MIDVARIKAATPTPIEVARRLGLAPTRDSRPDRVRVRCPWHDDDHPSCIIAMRDGRLVVHCHACHEGSDLLGLVAAVNGLDSRREFRRVAEIAAEVVGVQLDEGAKPQRRRSLDPVMELARQIDAGADDWERGRAVRIPALDGATVEQIREAHDLLEAATQMQIAERADMDRKLDVIGDELERTGRLEWRST